VGPKQTTCFFRDAKIILFRPRLGDAQKIANGSIKSQQLDKPSTQAKYSNS